MSLDAVPPHHLAFKETEFYSQCTTDVITDQIFEIDVAVFKKRIQLSKILPE